MRLMRFSSSRTFPGHWYSAKSLQRVGGEGGRRPVVVLRVLLQKLIGQCRNVVAALTQRRQRDADDIETEEEVFTKVAVADRRFQITIGGGHHADVDAHVLPSTEPRELAVLEHLEELRLQRRAHLADLVQEHRAVVGELELARLVLDGPGECAALETEELRFEQLSRQAPRSSPSQRIGCGAGRPSWIARATSSLPVPLSPRTRTVTSVSATRSINSCTSRIFSPVVISAACGRRGTELFDGNGSALGRWSMVRNSRVIQLAPPSRTYAAE